MQRNLGNTHHADLPPMSGQAWDLPGLILPWDAQPAGGLFVWSATAGSGLGSRVGSSTVGQSEPRLESYASCLLRRTQVRSEKHTGIRTA